MKILHTSDWHIGRTFHGADLHQYQTEYIDHVCDVVDAHGVECVLVSGDVFDRAIPSVQSVRVLADALNRLHARTRVILTPGNHDSGVRLGFTSELLTDRVRILADIDSIGEPVQLGETGGREVVVYGIPYLDPDAAREQLGDGENVPGRSHEAVLAAAMDVIRADLSRRQAGTVSIVMAHAFVAGGEASDSERDIRVGGIDVVPAGVFHGVDYVALGHLHSPQAIGTDGPVVRYSGSPLAYSFSEEGRSKSSILLEIGPDGIDTSVIAAPQPYRIATVTGSMDELLSGFVDELDAWLRVRVTDTRYPENMYARIKERFVHALDIQHAPPMAESGSQTPHVLPEADPLEVTGDFIEYVTGAVATDAESAVIAEAYERVQAKARNS